MSNEKDNPNQLQPLDLDTDPRSCAGNGEKTDARDSEPLQLAEKGEDRDSRGRFKKGVWKGGPGAGKSAASRRRLRERITQGLVDEAVDTAAAVMRDPKSRQSDRLKAAELIVVWKHGTPVASDILAELDELETRLATMATPPPAVKVPETIPAPPAPAREPEPVSEPETPWPIRDAQERMLQATAEAN